LEATDPECEVVTEQELTQNELESIELMEKDLLNYAKGIHCIRDRVKNNKQNKNTYETID
jgi:hypothetical protein